MTFSTRGSFAAHTCAPSLVVIALASRMPGVHHEMYLAQQLWPHLRHDVNHSRGALAVETLSEKVALVTGAAGGIGQAVARALGTRGARVGALDNNAQALGASVDTLVAEGLEVLALPADITSPAEVEAAVTKVEADLGPIDFLVNAAGLLRPGAATSADLADWDATFAVNTRGVFLMSRTVVNRMVPRSAGAIVTICSNAAATPRIQMAAYAASKAASAMYTKCLGLEVARYGIRCNVVSPGSTDSMMLRRLWDGEDRLAATLEGDPATFRLGIPIGKIATPADVAEAVVFLLSDEAGHVTLQDLTVDGGATLGV
jgi:2,3-dihydro-2,3-dihydroxybenzoate dehydrogenase